LLLIIDFKKTLEKGYYITAFARTPTKISIKHDKLIIVKGDLSVAESAGRQVQACALNEAPS
jgi:putative NADH-flavin reductase